MPTKQIPEFFFAYGDDERGFPLAASIQERAAPSDVTGFLDRLKYKLSPNWRSHGEPIRLSVSLEDKGTRWPDFLRISAWSRGWNLLVSENVVATLEKEGFHAFEAKPVTFDKIPSAKLAASPPPRYFGFRPIHELSLETRTYRYEDGELRYIGSYKDPAENRELSTFQTGMCRVRKPSAGSSLAARLFKTNSNGPGFMCTRHFVDLAFRERWTNLKLHAVDGIIPEGLTLPYGLRVSASKGSIDGPWYTELQAKAV